MYRIGRRRPEDCQAHGWWRFLNEDYSSNIIRAKGLFWLASRPDLAINFSQAGSSLRVENAGSWWTSMPYAKRIANPSFVQHQSQIEQRWTKERGDRVNELVFIGKDLEKDKYLQAIHECLLTEEEARNWQQKPWQDSFPISK
ncbi:MAG TPA: GTP-binding protein [Puia sp.]|jgi:G3E family GTPase|nr:GTP-binding protein [Puia sp.]